MRQYVARLQQPDAWACSGRFGMAGGVVPVTDREPLYFWRWMDDSNAPCDRL